MQILFTNDPDCLVAPFARAVLCASEIIGEDLQSWPLLEATSTPVQRAWVHALSEAPTGEVNLEAIVRLLKSLGLPNIRATTNFGQYLELILLSMPKILVERFFKCSLLCTACGYEHESFFLSLPGGSADICFSDAAKCFACKQCQQASFTVKELPTIMVFHNSARDRLRDIPVSYPDLGTDYALLSVIYSHIYGKKPKQILQQWVLDRNGNNANSLVYQFGRVNSGVKNVPHKTVRSALMGAGEPVLSQFGLLTFIMYLNMNDVPTLEKAKYLCVTSSLGSQQKHNSDTPEMNTSQYTGTVELPYSETISAPAQYSEEMPPSANTFRSTRSARSYFEHHSKESHFLQSPLSNTMPTNTLLPTISGSDYSRQNMNSAIEMALLRIEELERRLNNGTTQRSLQYTASIPPARSRVVVIAGLRIELWLLITLSVMGFLILLTFILSCIGISTPRATTSTSAGP